jgi:hypothetical protein
MEPGELVDRGPGPLGQHPWRQQARWVAGLPERSFWLGLRLRHKSQVPVLTYRCPRCWRLEPFAPPA